MMRSTWVACLVASQVVAFNTYRCDDPSLAFPLPNLHLYQDELNSVKDSIKEAVKVIVAEEMFNATSFSLEVTSEKETLFAVHHAAAVRSKVFPGTAKVDGSSLYRIASMTKPFTVLAILQQHLFRTLNLDDTVDEYIPALIGPQIGSIPWHDITIRALASQISGIPRDLAQQDLASQPELAISYGFPPVSLTELPQCDSIVNYTRRCSAKDLTDWVKKILPLFAPNQKSTYSNMNYDLLSLVIENVTGVPYPEYVQKNILDPLNMKYSTFDTPPESSVVIPAGVEYYWNFDIGIQKATGGLYSSTEDLSKFMRYVLTHYNGLTPALNWFQPTSWSNSMHSFYGMPWEIFRTNNYLPHSNRPITLVTKAGGLPGYTSLMIMMPDYGFGISMLVAGNGELLGRIRDIVVPAMVKYADDVAQKVLANRYAGTYTTLKSTGFNSSVILRHDHSHGLVLQSLVSNGTDGLRSLIKVVFEEPGSLDDYIFYVTPTLLYQNEERQQGERWRVTIGRKVAHTDAFRAGPWHNFCGTDVDFLSYGGLPANEIIFWGGDESASEPARSVELTGFRIVLDRSEPQLDVDGGFDDEL